LRPKTGCICVDYNAHTRATAMWAYFHVPVEQFPLAFVDIASCSEKWTLQ